MASKLFTPNRYLAYFLILLFGLLIVLLMGLSKLKSINPDAPIFAQEICLGSGDFFTTDPEKCYSGTGVFAARTK